MTKKTENSNILLQPSLDIAGVSGSCYVCGKKFAENESTVDMYGEEVCQQCADDEMYNMLGEMR